MDDFWKGWLVGSIGALIGVLFGTVFFSSACEAQELYAITTLKSYHQDRHHGYNEKNYGIGLELKTSEDVRFVIGEYKNSFYNKSNYVGVGYLPFHRGNWSAGFLGVAVSGYDFSNTRHYLAVAVPVVSYQHGKLLINSVIIPPILNMGMIGVQVGWKL